MFLSFPFCCKRVDNTEKGKVSAWGEGLRGRNREGGWCVQVLSSSCQRGSRWQGLRSEPVVQISIVELWAGLRTGEGPGWQRCAGELQSTMGQWHTAAGHLEEFAAQEIASLKHAALHTRRRLHTGIQQQQGLQIQGLCCCF